MTACKRCKKVISADPYRLANGKRVFCSYKCYGESKIGAKMSETTKAKMRMAQKGEKHHRYWLNKKRSPEHLAKMMAGIKAKAKGKPFCLGGCGHRMSTYNRKMCKKCWGLSVRGENNPQWIKDRGLLQRYGDDNKDRRSSAYNNWRKQVWLRDNFACKIANPDCAGRLEAHHILGYTEYPELRYKINNGITLCHAHHPKKRAEEKRLIPTFQELVSVSNKTF